MPANLSQLLSKAQFPLRELEQAIEALIAFRDGFDGHGEPPEEDDPPEHDGTDEGDAAWVEWTSMRGSQKGGANIAGRHEDDEEDDGDGECTDDIPGFDAVSRQIANGYGWDSEPGCRISDPDIGIEDQPEGGDCHGAHC